MKAIKLHGMAPDNAGDTQLAGAELKVSDDPKPGCIDEKRAAALVKANAASPVEAKAAAKDGGKAG